MNKLKSPVGAYILSVKGPDPVFIGQAPIQRIKGVDELLPKLSEVDPTPDHNVTLGLVGVPLILVVMSALLV